MSIIIDKINDFVVSNNYPVFSLSIISEEYGQESIRFCKTNRCQDSYSVAKAFVVTAVGLAVDRGLLNIGDKITDILKEYIPDGIDSRWYNVTVKDALTHKIGLPDGFLDIDVCQRGEFGTDYLGYMLKTKLIRDPGVEYEYTDGAYYLLSRIVEIVMNQPIDTLLWKELFTPMNFIEMAWSKCPEGHPMGATGLYITSDDMVKLGELYRNGGVYNGIRIISENWVNTVLTEKFEMRPIGGLSSPAYGKGGMKGQQLCVFPEKKLSVAWHAYGFTEKTALLKMISDI